MSTYVPKPNTGTLWPNNRKESERHPDMRGDIFVDPELLNSLIEQSNGELVKLSISAWSKVIANQDCFSLTASAPYVASNPKPAPKPRPAPKPVAADDDEEVPF